MAIKEWMISNPKLSIIVLSFIVTLAMTLVTKKFTNQNRMKELKEIQKACQIKLKDAQGNTQKMGEIQKEMMKCSIFFWWIRGVYTDVLSGWLWWYIGAGIASSIILRKVLKVV